MPNAFASDEGESADEIFRRMTEDLELNVAGITEIPVTTLTDLELLERFSATKRELYERKEVVNATTETGRDLQSAYHAYLLEMKKRKML